MVVAALRPVRRADELARRADDARVAVDELRVPDGVDQPLELAAVPAVVLVAERDVVRGLGRHGQRPLEVPVEAEALRAAGHDEPLFRLGLGKQLAEGLLGGAVVADHADPVLVRLLPDRVELAAEQIGRRLIGRHADRDPRAGSAGEDWGRGVTGGSQRRIDVDTAHRDQRLGPAGEAQNELEIGLRRGRRRRQVDQGHESAAVGVPACRVIRRQRLVDIVTREAEVLDPLPAPSDPDGEFASPLGRVVAVAAQYEGRAATDCDSPGWADLEVCDRGPGHGSARRAVRAASRRPYS